MGCSFATRIGRDNIALSKGVETRTGAFHRQSIWWESFSFPEHGRLLAGFRRDESQRDQICQRAEEGRIRNGSGFRRPVWQSLGFAAVERRSSDSKEKSVSIEFTTVYVRYYRLGKPATI